MRPSSIILIILFLSLLQISCSRKLSHNVETSIVVKDSISILEIITYDTIILPADSIVTTIIIKCDSLLRPVPFQVSYKSGRLNQAITLNREGQLTAVCNTDSLVNVIENKSREIFRLKQSDHSRIEKQVIAKCTRNKWFIFSLIGNVGFLLWFLRKPIFKVLGFIF